MKHIHCHSVMKTFLCNVCGHQSTNSCHLEQHMRIHTGVRPFKCEVCEKTFSQKPNLTRHKRIHSGEKPFICEICGKAFIESGKLSKHLRVHLGQKNYHCSKCGKKFAENRNLTQHMLIHSGEKPHKCLVCDRSFRYPSDLKEHKSVHTQVKPYACIICNKLFKSVRNLKKHTKFLHKILKRSENCNELETSHSNDCHNDDTVDQISKDNICIPEIIRSTNTSMSDDQPPASQMSCRTSSSDSFSHLQTSLIQNNADLHNSAFTSVPFTLNPHLISEPKHKKGKINDAVLMQPPNVKPSSQYESLMNIQDKVNQSMTAEQYVRGSLLQTISAPVFSSNRTNHIHVDNRVFMDISQSHPHIIQTFPPLSGSIPENYSNTMELLSESNNESNHHMNVQRSSGNLEVLHNLSVDEHLETAAKSLLNLGEGCLTTDLSFDKYSRKNDNHVLYSKFEKSESAKKLIYPKSACSDCSFTFISGPKSNILSYEVETETVDQNFEFKNALKADVDRSGLTCLQNSSPFGIDSGFILLGNKNNSKNGTISYVNKTCPRQLTPTNAKDMNGSFKSNVVPYSLSTSPPFTSHSRKGKEINLRTPKRRVKKFTENVSEKNPKDGNTSIEKRNVREDYEDQSKKEHQFECSVCCRFFRHKGSLRQHQQVHSYEHQRSKTSTKCPKCSKIFSKPYNLNQHLKIHNGIKSFRCDVCAKSFLLRHSLLSHQKTHSEEKPHACHRCPSKFKFKQDLVNHNRIHTGIKPYQCAECGKTFSLNSTLNRHLRTHTDARPYSCKLCGRVFSQNGNMHQHMKTHLTQAK